MNLGLVVDLCFVFEVGFDFEVAEKIVWHDVPHTTKTQSNPEGRLTRGATMWHLRFGNVKDHAMRLTPNLAFAGQCEAVFKFYERCFRGKIVTMLTYGKSSMSEQVPPRWREKILHASLTLGEHVLMGADPVPEQYEQPRVSP